MTTATIGDKQVTIEMEQLVRHAVFGESGKYWRATVKEGRNTFILTQLASETSWYYDAHFHRGIPVYCHGDGSRCCMKKVVKEGQFFDLLNLAKIGEKP
jgi:hypothetical protein